MNRKSLIAAAALAAISLTGYAVEGRQVQPESQGSSMYQGAPASTSDATARVNEPTGAKSREEVRAELQEAKTHGLYQEVHEGSPTPLDDQQRNQKLSQMQSEQQVSEAPYRDDLMALADRSDEAPVIIIEEVPSNQTTIDERSGSLPYDHPAIRGNSPSGDELQNPAYPAQ